MQALFFYLLAGAVLLASIAVVAHPNPLKGAMALVGGFFALAGLYAMIQAHMLAALQLLVYAGGIMVLVVFIIMLLDLRPEDFTSPTRGRALTGLGVAATVAVGGLLVTPILRGLQAGAEVSSKAGSEYGTVAEVGKALFTRHVFLFEAISLLLLVAVVGAVVMARRLRPYGSDDTEPAGVEGGVN